MASINRLASRRNPTATASIRIPITALNADCGVPLISGAAKLDEARQQDPGAPSYSMDISTDDKLVTIQTGKLGYIKSLQHILKNEQVPSLLASENASKG